MRGEAWVLAAVIALVALVGVATAGGSPIVSAGLDQDVVLGDTVYLDGGGTHVPDGELDGLEWSIETPDDRTISPECVDCEQTSFVPNETGRFIVTLTARSESGVVQSDSLYVTVGETDYQRSEPVMANSSDESGDGGSGGCYLAHEGDDGEPMPQGVCNSVGDVVDAELGGGGNYIDHYTLQGEGFVEEYSGVEYAGDGEYRIPADSLHHESVELWEALKGDGTYEYDDGSSGGNSGGIRNRGSDSGSSYEPVTGGYTLPPNYP